MFVEVTRTTGLLGSPSRGLQRCLAGWDGVGCGEYTFQMQVARTRGLLASFKTFPILLKDLVFYSTMEVVNRDSLLGENYAKANLSENF